MTDRNQDCSICRSVACIQGCICDDEIILLCSKCFSDHFSDRYKDHNPVELDLALRMQSDPSLISLYLEERVEMFKLLKDLRENLKKSQEVKQHYSDCKQRFIDHIETMFNQIFRETDEFAQDNTEKIKIINNYKNSLSGEGKALIEKYRDAGVEGLLNNTIESKGNLIDGIVKYMFDTINVKLSSRGNSYILAEEDRFSDIIKSKIAEKDKGYYSLRGTCKNQPAQKDSCAEDLGSNIKLEHQIFQKFSQIEESKSKLEMKDIKHEKQSSAHDIQSEEHNFKAKQKDNEEDNQTSKLDAQIEELISDLKHSNSEHNNRLSVKERQIIALEFCFRVAFYFLFAFTIGIEVAVAYLLTVVIFLWILLDKFLNFIIKRRVSRREANIEAKKEELESLLKMEDNQCINHTKKLRELLLDLKLIDAEDEDLVFLKDRQIVEVALHYGLAILISVYFKFSMKEIESNVHILILIAVFILVWYIVTTYFIQGKDLRREKSIHSIEKELESLIKLENIEYIYLANKLGELKLELKIKNAEHENHVSLRNRHILGLQRVLATATFLISLYGLSKNWYIAILHINLIINWIAVQDNASRTIVKYWKELRDALNDNLRL